MNQELTTYEPIIGIEIHVELATASKMFCGCPADQFGKEPNTQLCPICLGLPGALPVPNKKAVEWTILLGLALGCTVNEESKFDRKHYFYPDLPKGYQISQYDQPLAINGSLELKTQNSKLKTIRIHRVHLEEDTGKLMHATVDGQRVSLVDFNRSGVPLVEIVTEPDFRSVEEVDVFAKKLQQIVRYLGISGADMEKGSMRIEPSVSIRKSQIPNPKSQTISKSKIPNKNKLPAYRVEIKNINSFKFARNAITYEIERQTELLERGEMPTQQTRGFMESKGVTIAQREIEEAHDYRYFPEPDIPPMRFAQSQISNFKSQIGELPDTKRTRFMQEYGLSEYDAGLLVESRKRSDYFEEAVKATLDTGNQAIKLDQLQKTKVLQEDADDRTGVLVKFLEDGVEFRSHWDGSRHLFTPENSMERQWQLGADIHIAFDDCTSYPVTHMAAKKSLERTHRWATRSLTASEKCKVESVKLGKPYQALYGSIQGSIFEDLRRESAKFVGDMDFDGMAIGGVAVGETKKEMVDVLDWVVPLLPDEKPRHLLGVGEIDDIFALVRRGVDTFDCVQPTRLARMGRVYTNPTHGKLEIDITKKLYAEDSKPIDPGCPCYTCTHFSRAYIHHLFHVRELLGYRLTTIHNLWFMHRLVRDIREAIADGRLLELEKQWVYNSDT